MDVCIKNVSWRYRFYPLLFLIKLLFDCSYGFHSPLLLFSGFISSEIFLMFLCHLQNLQRQKEEVLLANIPVFLLQFLQLDCGLRSRHNKRRNRRSRNAAGRLGSPPRQPPHPPHVHPHSKVMKDIILSLLFMEHIQNQIRFPFCAPSKCCLNLS